MYNNGKTLTNTYKNNRNSSRNTSKVHKQEINRIKVQMTGKYVKNIYFHYNKIKKNFKTFHILDINGKQL